MEVASVDGVEVEEVVGAWAVAAWREAVGFEEVWMREVASKEGAVVVVGLALFAVGEAEVEIGFSAEMVRVGWVELGLELRLELALELGLGFELGPERVVAALAVPDPAATSGAAVSAFL